MGEGTSPSSTDRDGRRPAGDARPFAVGPEASASGGDAPARCVAAAVGVVAAAWVAAACGAEAPDADEARPGTAGPLVGVEELEPPAGPGSGQPRLSVGPDGAVLLSWLEPAGEGGGEHELRFAELAGGEWSEPRTAARGADFFVNWADLPSVVRTVGDSLVAHWLEKTGPGPYAYGVRMAFSGDGGRSWGPTVVPHRDGTRTEHGFVSLLRRRDGGVRAVWLDGRRLAGETTGPSAAMTLRSTVVRPDGEPRPATLLDGRVCDCCQTSAARTARGALVVYRDRSAGEIRDIAAVRLRASGWSRPTLVHADGWRIDACPVNGPAVDALGDTAAVAWFTGAGGRGHVRVAFSADAGASFGPATEVDGGQPAGRVDLVLLDGGRALVSWLERTGEGAEIRLRRVGPDGPGGPPRTLAPASAARAGGFPRMALDGRDLVLAWTDPSGEGRVRVVRGRVAPP